VDGADVELVSTSAPTISPPAARDVLSRRPDMTDSPRHERPDERDLEGLRSDHAGTAAEGAITSPAPVADSDAEPPVDTEIARDAEQMRGDEVPADDPTRSGQQGSQLGSAGGGYGSGSAYGSSGGTPDGEPGDPKAGPGPQTDWLRGAPGEGPTSGAGPDPSVERGRGGAATDGAPSDALGE
jgi:hypothetical protein